MKRETLRVEFVTPCFLGGASQAAEWRSASIRGELRWWFRAVAGAEHSLEEVREAEEVIFGSTERKSLLQVRALGGPAPVDRPFGHERTAEWLAEAWGDPSPETRSRLRIRGQRDDGSNPIHYLGFGPVTKGEVSREYLPPGEEAKIELRWGPGKLNEGWKNTFQRALWAWLNLGGIGAKSRKGFGSLRLLDVRRGVGPAAADPDLSPPDRETLAKQAGSLLTSPQGKTRGGGLTWTHVSEDTRVFLAAQEYETWEEAMEQLGAWLIGFRRRYGHRNDPRPGVAGRDYEWAAPKGNDPKGGFPDRAGFGLPLPFTRNVFEPALNRKVPKGETVLWGTAEQSSREAREKEKESRRASPLLLHVNRFGEGSYLPVLTWMPSEFLPGNGLLKFKRDRTPGSPVTDEQRGIVVRFLEDLVEKGRIAEVRP